MADDEDEQLAKNIPPPLPLWGRGVLPSVVRAGSLVARRYNFPRSHEQQNAAPPLTGFAHSLPIIKHRVARSSLRRGTPLREPLQDPRRGLHLARWFHERDRNEFEASQAKKERETKKRRDAALAAALAAKERVQETSEDDSLAVKGVNTELSSVAAFLKDKKEREKAGSRPDSVEEVQEPPTRRLVYDSADPEGKNLDRRLDDLEFDSWFESGNLRAAWRVENRENTYDYEEKVKGKFRPSDDLRLIELFTDKMNKKDFFEAAVSMNANLEAMCGGRYYSSSYKNKGDRFEASYGYAYNYGLGGTPLDESLMIIRDYIAEFKHNYGIDKLQFVTLTDGDSFSIDGMRYGTSQFFHDRRTKGTYPVSYTHLTLPTKA